MTALKKPLPTVFAVYFLCFFFRIVEYFALRTDQTFWGEAFLHKLAGIAVLFVALKLLAWSPASIGFVRRDALRHTALGLLLGLSVYAVAYGVEFFAAVARGASPSLRFYVTSYAVDGNIGNHTGLLFFVLCILGNIINVIMEEGVFRGLFQKLLQQKYTFLVSAVIASLFFGFWHVIGPLRNFYDGSSSLLGTVMNILMLVTTSALAGFLFALLTKLSGALYVAMGAHFVNNTIVNLLHIVTETGADELQVLRITLSQTFLFVVVLVAYLKKRKS